MLQIFIGAILTTITSLIISKSNKKIKYIHFIKKPEIFILNFLPIFLLSVIFSGVNILNGVAVVAFVVNTAALIHFYKVQFREEPLYFKDILIVKEALDMSGKYPLSLKNINVAVYFISMLSAVCFQVYKREFNIGWEIIIGCLVLFGITLFVLLNKNLYKKIYIEGLNPYIEIESYQSKGFMYPFLHSILDIFDYKYKNYDANEAKKILNYYQDEKIDGVNFVVVMLESFKDFSKVKGNFEFVKDPYEYFHKLEKESISGGLIVDSFGGGTFVTEMQVLNGFKNLPQFKNKIHTNVRYLKENGYKTTAHHPYKSYFYGRDKIYPNLGFEEFKNYDNCFKYISQKPLKDEEFFSYLMDDFKENVKKDKVFSFSVTYQNHGPYTKDKEGENFIEPKEFYDEGLFNYFNNYLRGISETSEALEILTKSLNEIERPTVLVLFGDHSPTMAEDKDLIDMLQINQDLETIEGVRNLYETPYLIWSNKALGAIKSYEKDLIEPAFLMPKVFESLGIKGSKYNQFLTDYLGNRKVIKDFLILNSQGEKTTLTKEQKHLFENTEFHIQKYKDKVD